MGKGLLGLVLLMALGSLGAETRVTLRTPEGTFEVRVSETGDLQSLQSPEAVRQRILEDLRILRTEYLTRLRQARDRREATALTNEIEDLVNLLWQTGRFTGGRWVVVLPSVGAEEVPPVAPMDPVAFETLVRQLEEESFSDDRLEILRTAAMNNAFTVAQVARLMDLFDFGDDRVEVVRILYPRVVDPENAHQLLSHVEFDNEKEALQRIFRGR